MPKDELLRDYVYLNVTFRSPTFNYPHGKQEKNKSGQLGVAATGLLECIHHSGSQIYAMYASVHVYIIL